MTISKNYNQNKKNFPWVEETYEVVAEGVAEELSLLREIILQEDRSDSFWTGNHKKRYEALWEGMVEEVSEELSLLKKIILEEDLPKIK
ncbi:MAG: hypothetical protein PVJ67_01060 [Candidatus Pacearchaeota archaeon]|jgi:hypothetical protein